jgi:hypothetical protein
MPSPAEWAWAAQTVFYLSGAILWLVLAWKIWKLL